MLRDYIGLREKEEKSERKKKRGESVVAGRPCQFSLLAHDACLSLSSLLSRSSRGPQAEFHSQVAHRADLVSAGLCGLYPPAPSWQPHSTLSLGMTRALEAQDRGSWEGQGSFMCSVRASQLSEILSFTK